MKTSIDLPRARQLLSSRADLLARGLSERSITARVQTGALRRVRRDRYAEAAELDALWPEGRHLVEVMAARLNAAAAGPVFWGPSAAVLHGLPLFKTAPRRIHVAIVGSRHTRTRAGIAQHDVDLPDGDVVEIDGMLCTSLDRTVLDLARTVSPEAAVAAADAALRRECMTGHLHDAERAAQWHARMAERAARSSSRGIRRARDLLAFADGRAQLPGESVSRLHLRSLGFRDVQLQVPVIGADGDEYWLDFGFGRSQVFGEFDGRAKYVDPALRAGQPLEDVLLAEKRREDDVRGVTSWGFARWDGHHIATPDALGRRLSAFGVRPPG